MAQLKALWEVGWIRRVMIAFLFIASGLSYPTLFRVFGQAYRTLDNVWVGFLLALLVLAHEGLHLEAMKKYGIAAVGPIPIPFLGALVDAKEPFPSRWSAFAVVLRGPLSGLIAVLLFALGANLHCLELKALAILWLYINAANLLPLFPLDGGLAVLAILGSISTKLGNAFVALSMIAPLAAACFWKPIVALIPCLAALELLLGWLKRKRMGVLVPVKMTPRQVAVAVGSYLGAIVILAASFYLIMRWPKWLLLSAWR